MEVPKSPFTLQGIKQSGISAFNQLKNNPIKTLTPRFITRTLEKIKKN